MKSSFRTNFISAWKRQRTWFLFLGFIIAVGLSLWMDPDDGQVTLQAAKNVMQGVLTVAVIHLAVKWLFDYPAARGEPLFAQASLTSTGAGLALVAKAIVFLALAFVFSPRARAAELPPGFYQYGPTLKAEQHRNWVGHPAPHFLAALVEQETGPCPGRSCWNPKARLKTAREEGAGLSQLTKAYRADGSIRFDTLTAMSEQYGDLAELNWGNVYQRPDLQLRALVLLARDAARPFKGLPGELQFGDSAYNGGQGDVQRARSACKMTAGCSPAVWFGNVELHCMKSRQAIYGSRSACDINTEHVKNVFLVRAGKYESAWEAL